MVDIYDNAWHIPKNNADELSYPNSSEETLTTQIQEMQSRGSGVGKIEEPPKENVPNDKTNWTNEYPTEFGITSFRRDKILGVSDTSKSILVHMINGHTYTITIKESVIPFFNRDGLTTADVIEDLKSD
jgi:hypothetical protein